MQCRRAVVLAVNTQPVPTYLFEMQATGPNDDLGQCHATCHEIEELVNPSMIWTRDPVPAGPPDRKFIPLHQPRPPRPLTVYMYLCHQ